MFLSNVLNKIGADEPDLPSMKCDVLPMSIVLPKSSTRERLQYISGNIDGTIKMFTARPTHDWWKPEVYDEKDTGIFDEENEDDADISEDDEVAEDAFEQSWSVKQSMLPIRAIDLFPHNQHILAYASREGGVGLIDLETHSSIFHHQDHKCGWSVMKAFDDNMIILGDEEGACVGIDVRCTSSTASNTVAFDKSAKNPKTKDISNAKKTIAKSQPLTSTPIYSVNKAWAEDDFGDYLTSLSLSNKHSQAIFGSTDKHVSSYDIRSGKFLDVGKNYDEINSLALLKDDELIITGSDCGPLSTYDIRDMETIRDRYVFQDNSVDFILPLDDDTILTGTDDGIVRIVTVNPTRIIGVVAVHKTWFSCMATQRGSLEQDDFIWANDLVCCVSVDNVVRFWSIQDMQIVRQNLTKGEKKQRDKKRALAHDDDDSLPSKKANNNKKTKTITKRGGKKRPGSDDDMETDNSDFDIEDDENMKLFNKMMVSYEATNEIAEQSKLRKKYGVQFEIPSTISHHVDINSSDYSHSDNNFINDGGDDTSDFDWDNDVDSDEDFEEDLDDDTAQKYLEELYGKMDNDLSDLSDHNSDGDDFTDIKNIRTGANKSKIPPTTKTTITKSSAIATNDAKFKEPLKKSTSTSTSTQTKSKSEERLDPIQPPTKPQQAKDVAVKQLSSAPKILNAASFNPNKFRKAHNHELANAKSTGKFFEKLQKQKLLQDAQSKKETDKDDDGNKKSINGLTQLPNIKHKLPNVRKLKHGSSNFFNGL